MKNNTLIKILIMIFFVIVLIISIILLIINSKRQEIPKLNFNNTISNVTTDNSDSEDTIISELDNEVILNSKALNDWKIEEPISEGQISVISYIDSDLKDSQGLSIIIYKPIETSNIEDIKDFISNYKYTSYDDMGIQERLTYVDEDERWMKFEGEIKGNGVLKITVYAKNINGKLCTFEVTSNSKTYEKYEKKVVEVIDTIKKSWNMEKPEDFEISIE